ncbi:protein C1orf43 homolog isoform X3 [Paramormyrops kingsleyae]
MKEEIESRLSKVHAIRYEPRLLSEQDDRLRNRAQNGCYNYLYRMMTLDAIRDSDIPFQEMGRSHSAVTGCSFRSWLLELRSSHSAFKNGRSALIDRLLEGYESARHGTGVFGEAEFLKYQESLNELSEVLGLYACDPKDRIPGLAVLMPPLSPLSKTLTLCCDPQAWSCTCICVSYAEQNGNQVSQFHSTFYYSITQCISFYAVLLGDVLLT